MKKEQGHAGGVAVLADQETPISLLRDIKRLLSLQQATDMPADGEEYRDYQIVAGAGDLYIDTDVQFGYAYIPNCPRDITSYSGTRGGLIGSFKTGAFVQFRMPRSTGVTITYGAGSAAQTLTVYLSAREVSVSPGSFLIDPGTAAGSLGKIEDTPAATGDVGVQMLAVRNDAAAAALTGTDGDYSPIAVDDNGRVYASVAGVTTAIDGLSNTVGFLVDTAGAVRALAVDGSLFNGVGWDRQRNITGGTVFASAARTETPTPASLTNYNGRSLIVVINVTAIAATPSVVFNVYGVDSISGTKYLMLASAAVVATGTTVLRIGPDIAAVANLAAIYPVPRSISIDPVHADGDSITYSVSSVLTL